MSKSEVLGHYRNSFLRHRLKLSFIKLRISLHPRAAAGLPRSCNARKLEGKKLNLNDSWRRNRLGEYTSDSCIQKQVPMVASLTAPQEPLLKSHETDPELVPSYNHNGSLFKNYLQTKFSSPRGLGSSGATGELLLRSRSRGVGSLGAVGD